MGKKATILSIGNELTSGRSVDTNSAWLSIKLAETGIETLGHHTVGDRLADIVEQIQLAAAKSDVVVITGGLGPTPDDLTRGALAAAMGVELELDENSLADIEKMFAMWHRTMADSNRVQAMLPKGAAPLANTQGTAPGIFAKVGKARVFVMPGVPREMKAMFESQVAPLLDGGDGVILHEIVHLYGLGESTVGEMLDDVMRTAGPVDVGTTVANGLVSVRIISRGATRETAQRQIDENVELVRQRCSQYVVGVGEEAGMAAAVGELLSKANQTLATAESCTGGLIGRLITDISGSSAYYLGGVISYANEVKRDILGVPEELLIAHGAVSEEVAAAMAKNVREKFSSDWGISTTGVAGPTGGTEEKPVGMVYTALSGPDGFIEVRKNFFSSYSRETIRTRASLTALDMLRRKLIGRQ